MNNHTKHDDERLLDCTACQQPSTVLIAHRHPSGIALLCTNCTPPAGVYRATNETRDSQS